MRELSTAVANHLAARGPRRAHLMVWLEARNRGSGATETIGFWTGPDHRSFDVGGETRTHYGAGTLLKSTPLVIEEGLKVRTQRLIFSSIPPEVQLAVRGYETRERPCKVYVVYFDALTHEEIDAPVRVFKGKCKGLTITRPKKGGGEATAEIAVQSSAVNLTDTLPLKKSDEALQARAPGDRLRRYTDIGGTVETVWGEIRAKAPEAAATGNKDASPPRESPNR